MDMKNQKMLLQQEESSSVTSAQSLAPSFLSENYSFLDSRFLTQDHDSFNIYIECEDQFIQKINLMESIKQKLNLIKTYQSKHSFLLKEISQNLIKD